jgi:hypothetical protein
MNYASGEKQLLPYEEKDFEKCGQKMRLLAEIG